MITLFTGFSLWTVLTLCTVVYGFWCFFKTFNDFFSRTASGLFRFLFVCNKLFLFFQRGCFETNDRSVHCIFFGLTDQFFLFYWCTRRRQCVVVANRHYLLIWQNTVSSLYRNVFKHLACSDGILCTAAPRMLVVGLEVASRDMMVSFHPTVFCCDS